jgi:hypothetical protein
MTGSMPASQPTFSVVVPVAPWGDPLVVASLARLDGAAVAHEVLVDRGPNASRNRNRGVDRSRGRILAFTDDDCVVENDWLANAARFLEAHPDVDAVGGPQLNLSDESVLGRAIGYALASRFGTGRTRRRFRVGRQCLAATERDLTSANLFITRAAFDRWGPFDERLWPNEETALLRRIEVGGGRIAYDPSIVVRHRRRGSLWQLARQCAGYGRGRARQSRIEGWRRPAPEQVIPLTFFLYLAVLPAIISWAPATLLLLAAYGVCIAVATVAAGRGDPAVLPLMPAVFAVIHLAYPAGILYETVRESLGRVLAWPGSSQSVPAVRARS